MSGLARRGAGAAVAAAFLGVLAASCAAPAPTAPAVEVVGPPGTAADLFWLAGEWRAIEGETVQEERWSAPLGGILLGTGRTVIAGKARFFEYLRIEERPDGLVYVASPLGRGATDFALTDGSARRVRFENPAHDWPTAIEYELRADGRLAARVSGADRTEDYLWERVR